MYFIVSIFINAFLGIVCCSESGLGLSLVRLEALVQSREILLKNNERGNADNESGKKVFFIECGVQGDRMRLHPFRPRWWPELDPVTGMSLLSFHSEE